MSNCSTNNSSSLPIGPQGIQGPSGTNGTPGIQGLTGNTGLKGNTGDAGLAGAKGDNGSITALTPIGASPNSNGATLTGTVLNLEPASATSGGVVSATTQTFAGAKTFSVLTNNLTIDSNGLGIGALASSRTYINAAKTFVTPLNTVSADLALIVTGIFTYTGVNSEDFASSGSGLFNSRVSGSFTPKVIYGIGVQVSNEMSASMDKSIAIKGGHTPGGALNTISVFNTNFLSSTVSSKSIATASTLITSNYDFRSCTPFQNNNASGSADPALFTITEQYGFYAEDYKVANHIPVQYGVNASSKVSAVITNAWQLYAAGTNSTAIGSYIGNRLGIGFTTQPTTNNQVTALLHIGASTATSAQMRLVVGVAPTAPNDGDIWLQGNTNTDLKIRINGVTKTISLV